MGGFRKVTRILFLGLGELTERQETYQSGVDEEIGVEWGEVNTEDCPER